MINAMKYKEEISNVGYDFRILEKNNKIVGCGSCADEMKCQECKFGYDEQGRTCDITRTEWLCQEYKEPIKLSRLEYEMLKFVQKQGAKYICRDESGLLNLYDSVPRISGDNHTWTSIGHSDYLSNFTNKLFQFVKWESQKYYVIKDVLNNCEVIDDD